ncbi:MAG: LuxR C-terminal-related transcriptional regulator [Sinobacteraceae bacterium]|nr:LuxR C-terminal-related transcriptional regulator [Nevskiaceae bacterium]
MAKVSVSTRFPRTSTALPLLNAKLSPPIAPPYAVTRSHIADRVFLSLGIKLVLVRGPAGFGKTTAMLQLRDRFAQEGVPNTWLNLDEADNDVPRFLAYLEAALQPVLAHPDGADARKERSGSELAVSILDRVSAHNGPFVLFFDECENIRNPAVSAFVTQLIDALPAGAQLIVGTRTVPSMGIARLRARGQLIEIGPDELRFSINEATDFLTRQRRLPLKAEQVRRLHYTTEGWVAGLSLASVALEKCSNTDELISNFAGSNAEIADYLAEDVLSRQSEVLREFLLKTSILDQLTPELCDALCGRNDSAEQLRRIERANLFLMPLDERRSAYRYHSLFAAFLRGQLERFKPEWKAPLNRAASDWYAAQGRPIPAIDYAIKAGDTERALELIEEQAEVLLGEGRLRLLKKWFDKLPAEALGAHPKLKLIQAWAVNLTHGPHEALALVEQMETQRMGDAECQAHLLALRPMLLGMSDQIEQSYALATKRLPQVRPEFAFARSMLAQTLANTSMILGNLAEARSYADEARQTANASRFNFSLADSIDGAIDLMQGRLKQAMVRLHRAADVSDDGVLNSTSRNAYAGVLLAEALYEAGKLDRAERMLGVFVPMLQQLGLPDHLITAHVLLARIVGDRGEREQALSLLDELEGVGHRLRLPRVVASARLERARGLIMRGDYAAAREQLDRAGDDALWQQIATRCYVANDVLNRDVGELRWLIRAGAVTQAIPRIKEKLQETEPTNFRRRTLKLRILLAEALTRDGQRKLSMRILEKALDFAASEGFVSSFLEEGPVVQGMLHEFLSAREGGSVVDSGVEQFLQRIAQGHGPASGRTAAVEMQSNAVDALTPKELQVLELLAQGYSNDAMADKLFVSESTVRTHLRNINVKLRAGNRIQALVIARRLKLIA